jgi:hypothetical protein
VLERALQQRSLRTCPALWSALGALTLQHKGPRSFVGVFYRAVDACTFRCAVTSFLCNELFRFVSCFADALFCSVGLWINGLVALAETVQGGEMDALVSLLREKVRRRAIL